MSRRARNVSASVILRPELTDAVLVSRPVRNSNRPQREKPGRRALCISDPDMNTPARSVIGRWWSSKGLHRSTRVDFGPSRLPPFQVYYQMGNSRGYHPGITGNKYGCERCSSGVFRHRFDLSAFRDWWLTDGRCDGRARRLRVLGVAKDIDRNVGRFSSDCNALAKFAAIAPWAVEKLAGLVASIKLAVMRTGAIDAVTIDKQEVVFHSPTIS